MQTLSQTMGKVMACLLTLFSLAAVSLNTPANDTLPDVYQDGSRAFNAGDYETALAAFLKARAQGIDTASLHYNLGVTYFKLERYEEARGAFLASAESDEMAPLAHYNLGLVALKQGQKEDARHWFQKTLADTQNPKLQRMASTMLAPLIDANTGTASQASPPPPIWSGFVSGGGGFDSNVTLLSDSETIISTEKNDQFIDFFASANARLPGNKNYTSNLDASLYMVKYAELSTFDTSSLRLGGSLDHSLKKWQLNSGLHYFNTRLDNKGYTQRSSASIRARRKLQDNHRLGLRYEYSYIDDLDRQFSFLRGWRQKAMIESMWLFRNKRIQFSYQLELNDRRDITSPRFTSFSPTRNSFRVRGDFQLDPQADASIDLRYRYSQYNDPTELADGSDKTRRESRYQVAVSITQNLKKGRAFSAEYRYIHNTSNFRFYDYNQHLFTINLLWPW